MTRLEKRIETLVAEYDALEKERQHINRTQGRDHNYTKLQAKAWEIQITDRARMHWKSI